MVFDKFFILQKSSLPRGLLAYDYIDFDNDEWGNDVLSIFHEDLHDYVGFVFYATSGDYVLIVCADRCGINAIYELFPTLSSMVTFPRGLSHKIFDAFLHATAVSDETLARIVAEYQHRKEPTNFETFFVFQNLGQTAINKARKNADHWRTLIREHFLQEVPANSNFLWLNLKSKVLLIAEPDEGTQAICKKFPEFLRIIEENIFPEDEVRSAILDSFERQYSSRSVSFSDLREAIDEATDDFTIGWSR